MTTCGHGMYRYSILLMFIFSGLKVFSVNQCVAEGSDSVGIRNGGVPRVVSNAITSGDEGGISRGKCRAVFSLLRTEQATMVGAIAGCLEPFNPEVESIVVYLERVELYFAANEIKADKRDPVFLNLIRRKNCSLLQSILSPQKPVEQPLKKLMVVLRECYELKKVVMAARFLFHQRQQQPGESVARYTWQNYKSWRCLVSLGRL